LESGIWNLIITVMKNLNILLFNNLERHCAIVLMIKIFILFFLVLLTPVTWAKHVPQTEARQVAVIFYRMNNPSGILDPQVLSSSVKSQENIPTLYIFRFVSGGFVIVAADDASIPILGYSFDNEMQEPIENPATAEWLDNYSLEITYIIANKLDNSGTLIKWNSIRNGERLAPSTEVLPLLTTVWDQGCYYNASCPSDPEGPCDHVWVGCVATAMSQIMKYHNFPPQGVGEYSYYCMPYGQQSADFENTSYNWLDMPDSVTLSNTSVATLMYHAGVSVNMAYSTDGSGANPSLVPKSLLNYFNYSPEFEIVNKSDYPDAEEFKNLLRANLNAQLPICYSGYNLAGTSGHVFVCDGYRMSDSTFHFNWGWSGFGNGYYAIGNLNPEGANYNYNNSAVLRIKPYNPDLIVRMTDPEDKTVVNVGETIDIKAKVVRGSSDFLKILIDDIEISSTTEDSITFAWNISENDLGSHTLKAYACNSTDTVYYKVLLNVSEWITQASGFPSASTPIYSMSAVDSNIVWASTQSSSDFTRTVNGGSSWTPGLITNTQGLGSAMIFGLTALKAYVAMYRFSGNKPQGIYMTTDGGLTWSRQQSASFSNPTSYPDIIHFFNVDDGVTMGDPVNNEFEIYTTSNGGNTWTLVPGLNIPDPQNSEIGIVGYYSVIHDTIWFGTNMGRVFKSTDKGLNWTATAVPSMSGKIVKQAFRNGLHGLLLDGIYGAGLVCESFDGGNTWTQVNFTGSDFHGDIAYVPGTPNTWVRTGFDLGNSGCAYSFDGGHTWTDFIGTNGIPYYPMAWINSHCGWAGGVNNSANVGGVYKFIGMLAIKPSPENVQAILENADVEISWSPPNYDPTQIMLQGYNIQRNGTKINTSLITDLTYTDLNVPNGLYSYCVSAQYDIGNSDGSCETVDIAVGIVTPGNHSNLLIYPNPFHNFTTLEYEIEYSANVNLSIYNHLGQRVAVLVDGEQAAGKQILRWNAEGMPSGIYYYRLTTDDCQLTTGKLVKY
jgi:photosystem II stability/assembly factor-like uncharacterized protein